MKGKTNENRGLIPFWRSSYQETRRNLSIHCHPYQYRQSSTQLTLISDQYEISLPKAKIPDKWSGFLLQNQEIAWRPLIPLGRWYLQTA